MFDCVLVANRGEIACRVIRTCRRMGIRTVAVHSDADVDAPHVRAADEAVRLGPAPATASYLDVDAVLAAAHTSGAQAVHPGYGFLSENADFAQAVVDAGLVWVGPTPDAIRLMGDKAAAKARMADAGVPVVPGVDATAMDDTDIANACEQIGYPVLLKAVAGGGGKGMRPVHAAAELGEALTAARREAAGAFGDDRLIVEKLVTRPRHVEVQVFGDTHGDVVHLFERECSIQRRHQKIVEETPSPVVDPTLREQMGRAAVDAARAVDYVGAGTVEFILSEQAEGPAFFFLEMNTRLQVEHPVTEMVTGVDLVEWQLRVAAGDPLPVTQDELVQAGSSIEVRLYAEDPGAGFLPQTGTLSRFDVPTGEGIRVDAGVEAGSVVSRFYDPMLAKLVVHAADRRAAVGRMRDLLAHTIVHGVQTNLAHLADVVATDAFARGDLATDFLDRHLPDWRPAAPATGELAGLAAVLAAPPVADSPGADPWRTLGPWRLSAAGGTPVRLDDGDRRHVAVVRHQGGATTVSIDDEVHEVDGTARAAATERVHVDGHAVRVVCSRTDDVVWAHLGERTHRLRLLPATHHADAAAMAGAGTLTSPMPGSVLEVRVGEGEAITAGQVLLVVEAMKMEHPVVAPGEGTVTTIHVATGDAVEGDAPLLEWTPATPGADEEGAG